MAPETNTILKHAESGKGLLTHVELFINQHDYICGQGNTIVIWNAIRYGSYYNIYRAYTTAIATPTGRWKWVINGQSFNSSSSQKRLKFDWGISSPNKKQSYLEMSDWPYVTYSMVDVYYEAWNSYGRVRSRKITIRKPYIQPHNCRRSEVTNFHITTPSGVVMTCNGYDESYPDMKHNWRYCDITSCDQQRPSTCVPVEPRSGRRIIIENAPVRIEHFESQMGFVGENVTLYCDVTWSRSIHWLKNIDTEITASDKYLLSNDKRQLTIVNVTLPDTATYTCNATERYDFDTAHARVIVLEPPTIIDVIIEGVSKTRDDTVIYKLYCRYETDPNLNINITWSLDTNTCPINVTLELVSEVPHLANVTIPLAAIESKCPIMCSGQSGPKESCHQITLSQSETSEKSNSCSFSYLFPVSMEPDYNQSAGEPNVGEVIHGIGDGIKWVQNNSPLVVLPYMDNGDLRTYISSPDMVADFGLSRDIYHQEYYRIEDGKNPLPVRWMAPECLQEQIFTTKSDVWSYGVLLWELVTRGATPYPGIENWAIIRHIKQGWRMKQPLFCPNTVYTVMMECWHQVPKLRPSFETLEEKLEEILYNPISTDPSTATPRQYHHNTLEMGIKGTKVTRLRTNSAMYELVALTEI
ncbi:hypothetical protein LSH36_206g02055 [Paralvinella palmiformis]|uniref:receptor protein-tyrosine kinase n=1 Tax=Paralvinella palmiformis TaxID=53620 RepID=A0AAD9JNZ9_9ANNE|nr:hypothetical protein LSH36_206g02055 [Paralvinella palmiformis]